MHNKNLKKSNIITLIVISMVSMASISSVLITPALSNIQKTYTISDANIALLMSTFLIGYMIGQLLYGPLANRYGRIRTLRIGLMINLLGIVIGIIAVTTNYYLLLLSSRFITALGASAGLVLSFILLNEYLESKAAKQAMTFIPLSFTLGIAISVFIGGIITEYFGWQYCYIALLIHGVFYYWVSFFLPETLLNDSKQLISIRSILGQFKAGFKNATLIIYGLILGFTTIYAYTYSIQAPLIANNIFHLSPGAYGSWNLLNTIGMLIGIALSGYLAKKFSSNSLIAAGYFLTLTVVLILYGIYVLNANDYPLWFFTGTSLLYIITSIIYTNAGFLASNSIPDRASASSVMNFINIGSAELAISGKAFLPFSEIAVFLIVINAAAGITFLLFKSIVSKP
jgi:DHA1 family bicyclomycin/chloramphenicol resistance-like MFS transporter